MDEMQNEKKDFKYIEKLKTEYFHINESVEELRTTLQNSILNLGNIDPKTGKSLGYLEPNKISLIESRIADGEKYLKDIAENVRYEVSTNYVDYTEWYKDFMKNETEKFLKNHPEFEKQKMQEMIDKQSINKPVEKQTEEKTNEQQ